MSEHAGINVEQELQSIKELLQRLLDRLPAHEQPVAAMLTVADAARFLNISKSGIYRLHEAGKIKGHRPSGNAKGDLRFTRADLQRYIAGDDGKRGRNNILSLSRLNGVKPQRTRK